MHKSKIFIAGASVLAAGGAIYAATQKQPMEKAAVTEASPGVVKEIATRAPWQPVVDGKDSPTCKPEKGAQWAYSIKASDRAKISPEGIGLPAGGEPIEVSNDTDTRLVLDVLEGGGEQALLLARFVRMNSSLVQRDGELERPFLFNLDSRCQLIGFAHHKSTPAAYARIQQALLHELVWAVPAGAEGEQIDAADGMGTYRATLGMTRRDAEFRVASQKVAFEPWHKEVSMTDQIETSVFRVYKAKNPWFDHAEKKEVLTGKGSTLARDLSVRTLALGQRVPVLEYVASDYLWADLLPLDLPLDEQVPLSKAEKKALERAGKLTFEQAFDELESLAQSDAGIQATWPSMRVFLEARPEQAQVLVDALSEREFSDMGRMSAFIALGHARTPQARQALEGVVRDETTHPYERSRAMVAMIGRGDTGLEFAQFLSQMSQALESQEDGAEHVMSRHALLALGAMAGMKPDDAEIKREAVNAVTVALARLEHPANRRPAYNALANIGDPALLSLVADIAQHPNWQMRYAAANVTRRMPPAASAEFSARWLEQEESDIVKYLLYKTIELQTYDSGEMTSREILEFALKDLARQPHLLMRRSLIDLLARAMKSPEFSDMDIEGVFLALVPFELHERSGLYSELAKHVDSTRLRAVLRDYEAGRYDAQLGKRPTTPNPSGPSTPDPWDTPYPSDKGGILLPSGGPR
jgi:hypothetical protein